jgi:hypothetical protein
MPQLTPQNVVAKSDAVVWRHAGGHIYLVPPNRQTVLKIEGLALVAVPVEEVKSVFGDSSDAVIRISNQI